MANDGAFVLPAGVRFELDGDKLSITHPGDIVIEGAPDQPLKNLRSQNGNVILRPSDNLDVESVSAPGGAVRIDGKVNAVSIQGRTVEFEGGSLKVEVLVGTESAQLAGKRLDASVVIAPTVEVSTKLKGRATAIQSDNETGPHKLKGGFSLSEFVSLMPGGAELLAAHGIEVPEEEEDDDDDDDEDAEPAAPPGAEDDLELIAEVEGAEADDDEIEAYEDEADEDEADELDEVRADEVEGAEVVLEATAGDEEIFETTSEIDGDDDLDVDDLFDEEFEPDDEGGRREERRESASQEVEVLAAEDGAEDVPDEVRADVDGALERIRGAYGGQELPPPVQLVEELVERDDYGGLRLQINGLWSDLIRHHTKNPDQRMPNAVGPLFQQMQGALRKL